ncbi:pectinesterase [Mucilaginibacter yixingensis]|uniref:Pectinesterase n=1 Tax=Mucilaginibacter yixingensis TaxID=1295612 RepID=A0A2T5J5M0_9SPHI|nr:pectinesterase family protein [Mucilaginibacter yixingensis]PTQ93544.1 pectinesterase [Mucilaginibacter yixingensis]
MSSKFFIGIAAALCLFAAKPALAQSYDVVVAQDGSGKYTSVQAAINAAPSNGTKPYRIFIKHGVYNEKLTIPQDKTFLEFVGENVANTILTYGDGKGGTSATIINADDVFFKDLTLVNSQGAIADGPQSQAVRTTRDRAVFFNCRFISGQDTMYLVRGKTRAYFLACYIDGNTDYIYGDAIGLFDNCVIYARDRLDGSTGGYITAASTKPDQPYGLVFRNCLLPDNHGITNYTLGRPWQNDKNTRDNELRRAHNKTVFLNTKMGSSIKPEGWSAWNDGTDTTIITYAEYNSRKFNGAPVDVSRRRSWTQQLTAEQAAPYFKDENILGDWNPFKTWADLPAKSTAAGQQAISNLLARDNGGNMLLQFNTSWPASDASFVLYKSDDKKTFKKADQLKAGKNDVIAFQFKDKAPADGQHSYYVISATQGKQTFSSDTLDVSGGKLFPMKKGR